MAQKTIAQLREMEVEKLARLHTPEPSEADMETARRLMGSFYRLCGLAERNLYLANEERTCNKPSTKASEEREDKWYKRLSAEFTAFCGLRLFYSGYAPSIGTVDPKNGGCSEKINRWFYN